jgi:cytoskeleton-associated protein 5
LWCIQAIKEFGYQNAQLDLKQLIGFIKKGLENSNQGVRLGSIQLIGTLYMYIGAQIRALFETEKSAILEQIDAEIEKNKGLCQKKPCRNVEAYINCVVPLN